MTLKTLISGGIDPVTGINHPGIIVQLVTPVVQLMFAAAVFFFLWNVFKLITVADQPKEMAEFKSRIMWGIIAIAVMASMWGLVTVIMGSTGLDLNSAALNIRTGP